MVFMLRTLATAFLFLLTLVSVISAQEVDVSSLEKIGPVTGFVKTEKGIRLNCRDNSQVQLTVLAPDLVRVRASFTKAIPARDHSWAIGKENWATPPWTLTESAETITIATSELEVVVHRSPLLIDFRDARTHQTINADQQPMAYDGKGTLAKIQFDPAAGMFVAAAKKLGFDEHFYGLGEKAAGLDKRRDFFVNWNSDTPGYTEGRDPIYQTIPFYIGLQNSAAYGIFFDNSYRSYFDFGRLSQERVWFGAEGGELNYYFFYGPSIKKILSRYTDLTGHMPMMPLWSLGVQQCRYSYYPDSMVERVAREYRERDLPLDVIYLDIHYMNGYRVFTFDTNRFPDPKRMVEQLAAQGVKTVVIVDPGVKYQPPTAGATLNDTPHPELERQDQRYYVFDRGAAGNYFQRRKSGELFIPHVWPGESTFVDFTLPDARRWWGDLHRAYTDNGVMGIWNDMNEPSDFID